MRKRGPGLVAVIRLVGSRLARRRGAAALVALAVAGAIVVVGSLFGVGVVTADVATQRALAEVKPIDRVISVNRYADAGGGEAADDAAVRAALGHVAEFTEPVLAAASLQPHVGFGQIAGLDDVGRWVVLKSGRLPVRCDGGSTCEAILVTPFDMPEGPSTIGTVEEVGGIRMTIVGYGAPSPDLPFELFGLAVDGVQPILASPLTIDVPRTTFWIAPLDPARTHAWNLAELATSVDAIERDLAAVNAAFVVASPDRALGAVESKTAVATGRLVFIGSLIVAVLLAFAVFAAAVDRDDVALEYRRLRVHGAGRLQLGTFIAAEAAVPAIAGAVLGWLGAAAIVSLIGLSQGAPPAVVLQVSLLEPLAVTLIGGIALLALVAVALGIHPSAGRLIQPRLIAAAVIPVVAVLAWDRYSQGQLDSEALARAAAGPGTVLFPGLLGLTVILGSLVVLPPIFRRLARAARRSPLAVRLALMAIAREPLRPAATLTLLAFSLGAAVFALGQSATLRQGAADEAAYIAGMDIRVAPLTADAYFGAEIIRYMDSGILGPDVQVHPILAQDAISASGRPLTVLGIEPEVVPDLRGWRADFSPQTPTEIATAIAQPGDWRMAGVDLPTGVRTISIDVESSGDQVRLTAIVERNDPGHFGGVGYDYVRLGDLTGGHQTLSAELFPGNPVDIPVDYPKGWRIVALIASNGGPANSTGTSTGERQQATVTIHGLEGVVDPATPVHLDVSGSHAGQILRGPVRTDGLVLPAVVSPDLADDVGSDGVLTISMPNGLDLRVRPVATATHVPTLVDPKRDSVVVDEHPLFLALNGAGPGAGVPNAALLRTPDDTRAAAVAQRLEQAPFPPLSIQARVAIEDARANDPFAIGVVWALFVGALAGLGLSLAGIVLAASARLRDDRGDLGELEEQGLAPAALESLTVLQTIVLAIAGILVGSVVGLGLGWLAAASLAVTPDGAPPIPPLVLVAPWLTIGGLAVAVLAVLAVAVLFLARRHFRGGLLREVGR
jgi:hypothetical protein